MTKKGFVKFYIKNNPYFNQTKKLDCGVLCINSYGNDLDCNCMFLAGKKPNLNRIEKEFDALSKKSTVYQTIEKGLDKTLLKNQYKFIHSDDWLVCKVKKLLKKYQKLSCPENIVLEKVDAKNFTKFKQVSQKGFSAQGADNPYGEVELEQYYKCLKEKITSPTTTNCFLINIDTQSVGAINLSIEKSICYISGFTIVPEFRRSKIFVALKKF